jgi:diaminopimelate decarboxylase
MHSNNLPHVVIYDTEGGEEEVYDVVGSTCMEKDVILKDVPLKRLKAGDYIEIGGVGAYTICLTPTFINYLAPIVSIEKEDVKLVRRRQQLDDILTIYER